MTMKRPRIPYPMRLFLAHRDDSPQVNLDSRPEITRAGYPLIPEPPEPREPIRQKGLDQIFWESWLARVDWGAI